MAKNSRRANDSARKVSNTFKARGPKDQTVANTKKFARLTALQRQRPKQSARRCENRQPETPISNIGATATESLEALDLDDNGTVDAADLEQHYTDLVGTSNGGTGTFAGDANLDGIVDVLGDAAALVNNLGSTNRGAGAPSTAAVPEPGCLALLALTGVGAAIRRRR